MPNVDRWTAIFNIITLFIPLIEWVVNLIERSLTSKPGEEKKAVAMKVLSPFILGKAGDEPEAGEALSMTIDTMVTAKNLTGEFSHTPAINDPTMIPTG